LKIIYSYGGFAREAIRLIREQYKGEEVIAVDDAPFGRSVSYQEAKNIAAGQDASFVIASAEASTRRKHTALVEADGFQLFSTKACTSIIGDNVTIGEGSIISDYAILTADMTIGRAFHCNIYSYVAHDCIIGDFVTLAPRVSVNGRVIIEDDVYIGTGATILPGQRNDPIVIGKGAVIGAHALVTKNIEPGTTVVGMPAKPIPRK
jgi:sugar O-acyltransferase (sialic acid O-acetyltransferase NeuD family)